MQAVIDSIEGEIIASCLLSGPDFDYKSVWTERIKQCADEINLTFVSIAHAHGPANI